MAMGRSELDQQGGSALARRIGLLAGPALALALALMPPPEGLSQQGWTVAAVVALMAVWWMTEAIPLAATALLPLIVFPLLQVSPLETAARSYAHPLIFLFLGGFLLARAMERWRLSHRLARRVMRLGGAKPDAVIASLMATTAFLSMWVSNTAATMVMLPIGLSMAGALRAQVEQAAAGEGAKIAATAMLAIAFSATIGGMGTLIGTPPNALFAGFMQQTYGVEIGFAQWMMVGIPAVLVLLPITWLILTRVAFPLTPDARQVELGPAGELDAIGAMGRPEKLVALIMLMAAAAWLSRPLIASLWPGIGLSDAGIALTAALALFLLPADWRRGEFLLSWNDARTISWDVLILFGGGLALAQAINDTGLAAWIGESLKALDHLPRPVLLLLVMAIIVALGELASNTAMAAIFLPVAGAAAAGLGDAPLALAMPVALAASLGFMLPVATPPNAIVFGSGALRIGQMLRAGVLLDVLSVLAVAALVVTLGPLVFAF